jgi:hypothetical protein
MGKQEVGGGCQERWAPAPAETRIILNQVSSEQRLDHPLLSVDPYDELPAQANTHDLEW